MVADFGLANYELVEVTVVSHLDITSAISERVRVSTGCYTYNFFPMEGPPNTRTLPPVIVSFRNKFSVANLYITFHFVPINFALINIIGHNCFYLNKLLLTN